MAQSGTAPECDPHTGSVLGHGQLFIREHRPNQIEIGIWHPNFMVSLTVSLAQEADDPEFVVRLAMRGCSHEPLSSSEGHFRMAATPPDALIAEEVEMALGHPMHA
jgi:hypothetical protein